MYRTIVWWTEDIEINGKPNRLLSINFGQNLRSLVMEWVQFLEHISE